ncbi:hypothetical protein ES707_16625 [subsurface metagenome]
MKFLKGVAIGLLSFLLFLSLSIFGIAFLINQTVLNPNFVTSQLDKFDVAALVEEIISEQEDEEAFSEELETALVDTIGDLEPAIREQLYTTLNETYDYLLGKREEPDLKTTLGNTFFNSDFVSSMLDNLDLPLLLEESLPAQTDQEDFSEDFVDAIVNTVTELESDIKQKIAAASDPVFDYLLGETESIDLASTLRNTVLTSDITLSLIDKIAVFFLASESLGGELTERIPEEMDFLADQLDDLMPELTAKIEQQISANVDQLLDYLLGQRQTINIVISLQGIAETLEDSLREHLMEMSPDVLKPRFEEILTEQITQLIPAEAAHLSEVAITDEWVDQQTNIALNPVLSYMLGESSSLNVTISLEPVLAILEEPLRQEFMESPPPELAGLPSSEIEQYFDDYYQELIQDIPSTIVIDENMLGADLPAQVDELFSDLAQMMPASFNIGEMLAEVIPAGQITDALTEAEGKLAEVRQDIDEALAEAEEGLEQAREYIGYFQLGYKILIGFIVLLIAGIIFTNRQVKGATRKLGTIFLTCGVPWFAGIFVGKYFAGKQIAQLDIPSYFQELLPRLVNDCLAPLQWFSLGLLIGGAVLIVVSFVYPRWRQTHPEPPTIPPSTTNGDAS